MSQRQTLADFRLQRGTRQNRPRCMFAFLEGKADPVIMARDGQSFYVEAAAGENVPNNDHLRYVSFTYTKNVAEKTLVVFAAFLTGTRAWQMIVDGWLTAGGTQPTGDPEGLQYLAFHDVIELQAKVALAKEMEQQWSDGRVLRRDPPESVEYTAANSGNWLTNPWIRCSQRVAAALSTPTQQIVVSRVWSIYMGRLDNEYHLIVELASTPLTPLTPSTTSA